MPSESTENRATRHALGQVFDYISPGTNEGISFSLSRLTDDLFTNSFLAGGDISLFTPSSHRGRIRTTFARLDARVRRRRADPVRDRAHRGSLDRPGVGQLDAARRDRTDTALSPATRQDAQPARGHHDALRWGDQLRRRRLQPRLAPHLAHTSRRAAVRAPADVDASQGVMPEVTGIRYRRVVARCGE
jgi:hypothetical protein